MAKSADDVARILTFPTTITVRSSVEDCCCTRDPEEDDSTCGEDFPEAGAYSKRNMIDFLANE